MNINIFLKKKSGDINIISNEKIIIPITDLSMFELKNRINKIRDIINIYKDVKKINIIFDKNLDKNILVPKLNDILHSSHAMIKFHNIDSENKFLMKEISNYKDIVNHSNKTPDDYLKWIKKNTPSNYKYTAKKTTNTFFPLTHAVASGSIYNGYFVHIFPKKINPKNKNVYFVGKAITYDSGGMNIKGDDMCDMKTDMAGSAILVSVLRMLDMSKLDKMINLNLMIPIAENMIGPKGTKPGSVVKSMSGKKVEIVNTDAEGRLCMADCFDYINMIVDMKKNNIILDIATLTGSARNITGGIASVCMGNKMADKYISDLINIGENVGEYVDTIRLRKEYLSGMESNVADIKNINEKIKAGCITAGAFLEFFINEKIPWIHMDVAPNVYINDMVNSYGINLLYNFLASL